MCCDCECCIGFLELVCGRLCVMIFVDYGWIEVFVFVFVLYVVVGLELVCVVCELW